MTKESDIIYESQVLYVVRVGSRFEIRKHHGTHSILLGHGKNQTGVLRCAKRLELYPKNI